VNEGFGRGFYIALGTIPFAMLVYSVASSPKDNFLNRLVRQYDGGREVMEKRDALHTTMMERAAADRQLFAGTPVDPAGPSLRMQESFNFGSPWNVSAGQGTADLSELAKFYEEKHKDAEQERIKRFKKQKGSVYDM